FVRKDPSERNYYVAAGLDDLLKELEDFRFSDSDIRYMEQTAFFSPEFIDYLKDLRFSGTVYAMPEGTIFFPNEPILEITAPIIEAQILETLVLNTIGFQTLIAAKAARCLHAAGGKPLIDFSLRRTQGHWAGIKVARSTYIAGFTATSNVLAGKIYGIPVSGTMAHSFITAFDSEHEAFHAYAKVFPESTVLLIDTYDTIEGAKNAVRVAQELRSRGKALVGVRLDSGDMVDLSKKVRRILDAAGFPEVKIFASSGFDEYKIDAALSQGAEIDAFGVGTKVGVAADAPHMDIVYKLVQFDNRPVRKLSPGKMTLAGKKQVFRDTDPQGRYVKDIIGLRDDRINNSRPLLEKFFENGIRTQSTPSLESIRNRFKENFSLLGEKYKEINKRHVYPVELSPRLEQLQNHVLK
ncbi:MAG TPA: nicotinate phosphoribosyltransferase, partial [Deltaproteobacteria bacterium]|nr:nicotinate phosphoribosyltransferase [Deltaproteobacteria bacterium]